MGDRTITRIDDDTYTFQAYEGLADPVPDDRSTVGGTGRRIYAYRTSVLTQMFADLSAYIGSNLTESLNRQEVIFAREGIAHSCYEGGHHLINGTGANHNGIIGLYNEVSDDPRFLDLMDQWWDLETSVGVESQNWFKIISCFHEDDWGLLRTMEDTESIKYPKALAMAAGGGPDPDPPGPDDRFYIPLAGGLHLYLMPEAE